jgi:ATP-dependent helicase HrpA
VWSKEEPPAHLLMNIRVVDEARRELAMGRNLDELRKRLGEAASLTLAKAQPGMEREGIRAWDFGELPEQVTFRRGNQTLTGYPALALPSASPLGEGRGEGQDNTVAIRLFDTRERAEREQREGVKRLLSLELREQLKQLDRTLQSANALLLRFHGTVPADRLKADMLAAIVDRAFLGDDPLPRTPKAFEEQKKRAKARLPAVTEVVQRHVAAIAEANAQLTQALAGAASLGRVLQDVKAARDRLVHPGFLAATPWERLEHLPRYLKGYAMRLAKYRAGGQERDGRHGPVIQALWNHYENRAKADQDAGRVDPKLEEFRWLIEELRVSLFAQELRTPFPVSAKRLQKFWDEHLR